MPKGWVNGKPPWYRVPCIREEIVYPLWRVYTSSPDIRMALAAVGYPMAVERLRGDLARAAGLFGWERPPVTLAPVALVEPTRAAPEPVTPTPEEAVERAVAEEQARLRLAAEQRVLRELATQEARLRNWQAAIKEAAAALPPPPAWAAPEPRPVSVTPHALVLHLTDMHAGKYVDPTLIGEPFTYNRSLLEQQIARWHEAVEHVTAIHRSAYPVDTCYVLITGDMVEGSDMRPAQKIALDHAIGTIGRQTVYVGRVLALLMRRLKAQFRQVIVVAVGGNHGRVGLFGHNAKSVDNFDWLAYQFMAESLRGIDGVRVEVPDTTGAYVKIGARTWYLQHGDEIRSWGESPANALKRGTRRQAFVLQQFPDYFLSGHVHHEITMQLGGSSRLLVGGNWDGGDAYSVECVKERCEPSQLAFIYHPTRGVVAQYSVTLREPVPGAVAPLDLTVEPAA